VNRNEVTQSFIRKLSAVQFLIRRTYGPNAFVKFSGWDQRRRKHVEVRRDPWLWRIR
jgi:hypothetical protein